MTKQIPHSNNQDNPDNQDNQDEELILEIKKIAFDTGSLEYGRGMWNSECRGLS